MATLSTDTLSAMYGDRMFHPGVFYDSRVIPVTCDKFIEIPTVGDEFEIPCFAFKAFLYAVEHQGLRYAGTMDKIVAPVFVNTSDPRYKSLESNISYYYTLGFSNPGLTKVRAKDTEPFYYIGYGTIFKEDFTALVTHSWIIRKEPTDATDGSVKYKFVRPVIRINPDCFVRRNADTMMRLITGKLLTTTIELSSVQINFTYHYRQHEAALSNAISLLSVFPETLPKVEIDCTPYRLVRVPSPSISTELDSLKSIALNHLDEILA